MICTRKRPIKVEDNDDDVLPVLEAVNAQAPNDVQFQGYDDGYEYVDENGYVSTGKDMQQQEQNIVEFNFVDNENVACGICSDIVPYDSLFNDHMPNHHSEFLEYTLEDVQYDAENPSTEESEEHVQSCSPPMKKQKAMKQSFSISTIDPAARPIRSTRTLRRVSQIRVNTQTMSLEELESKLRDKMVEKMGRAVPVSLVDKEHARCGICNTVLSLNRKFEVVHLIRHFNAWHPTEHKCTGEWLKRCTEPMQDSSDELRPLSQMDFAVVDLNAGAPNNLQCIWCGMFMEADSIAMHFHEIHPETVEAPNCRLCLHELVANSRYKEKFGKDMEISLPDEYHFKCGRFGLTSSTESAMDRAVTRELKRQNVDTNEVDEEIEEKNQNTGPESFGNNRMVLSKGSRPKRQFVMPSLRQAAPTNSEFVEFVNDCHWTCKLCNGAILAAVISAGAIKHFRQFHPESLEKMQFEICKTRLEYVSDGCMEFLGPEEIKCTTCDINYPLHKPYNMCRAIRHLKLKHPERMPEYNMENITNNGSLMDGSYEEEDESFVQ